MRYDLGFLGGGQLARMSIQAAQRMGLRCASLDPGRETPASAIAAAIQGELADPERIAELMRSCERVTLENEFIPADSIRRALELARVAPDILLPGVETLVSIQDKLLQRHAYSNAGVPSPRAVTLESAEAAIGQIGFPMVLKARFGGYDGKGIRYAKNQEELLASEAEWGEGGWLAEEFVPFKRELAAMVFISAWGAGCFPTMETVQKNHVCDLVYPSGVDAKEIALAAVEAVGGQGLFGVEMFELESGEVLVNEIAPRPHNTGHYTLDWGATNQFEQHVRLAMAFPLASVEGGREVCMANLLGIEGNLNLKTSLLAAMEDPGVHVHWYGKAEMRKGRKMGHLNAVGPDCINRAIHARSRFFAVEAGA